MNIFSTTWARRFSSLALAATTALAIQPSSFAAADAGLGHDYRTYHGDGKIAYGKIGDSYTADLVMYLAGNQFMVMNELIGDFQKKNPEIKSI